MRNRFLILLLLALAITALAFPAQAESLSPTTGMPTDKPYRPVLVQINNNPDARRPIHGFSSADIVYEGIYWGPGHTRYLALFNDEHPEAVGSVRSTRVFFNELREMWDCPIVYYGAQSRVSQGESGAEFFRTYQTPSTMLVDGTRSHFPGFFFRDKNRVSPHNGMIKLEALVESRWPEAEGGGPYASRLPALTFSDTPTRGEQAAHAVDIIYDAEQYAARYVYDEAERHYIRWYDGKPQKDDTGRQVVASNVIVQYMWLTFYDNIASLPVMSTLGSGPIDAFIDGTYLRGTWVRDEMDAFVRYLDEEGNELVLLPGKTFVQFVPMEMTISFEDEAGQAQVVGAAVR